MTTPRDGEPTSSTRMTWGCSGQATATDRRNLRRFVVWLAAWAVVFLSATFAVREWGGERPTIVAAALVASLLACIPWLRAYLRFLREADELTRSIQLRGCACAFGAGVIVGMVERLLAKLAAFAPDASLWTDVVDLFSPTMVMMVTFSVSTIVIQRRYWR